MTSVLGIIHGQQALDFSSSKQMTEQEINISWDLGFW